MKKVILVTLIILINKFFGIAGTQDSIHNRSFSLDSIYSNFSNNLDSIAKLFYVEASSDTSASPFHEYIEDIETDLSQISDSVLIERLRRIPALFDLSFNTVVRRYIEVYLSKRRSNVENMLGLADYYFPIFDDIFDYYDVPNEMKYMSIIESALNPRAVSRAGAVGLWQFMYSTGRLYGLSINSLVDERRDPIKSTHAAARFVKDLYKIYGDWTLVIAAYNCGPGNVNKAIRRSGGKKNYWDIYYYLPRETRGHVPAFIAANYIMHYYQEHGLKPKQINMPLLNDTLMIKEELHLGQVAEVLDIPIKEIRDLNPQYRRDIIPASSNGYSLRLPAELTLTFIDLQDSIFAYKDSIFFQPEKTIAKPASYSYSAPVPPANKAKLYYTVKSGDNLGYISEWYNVRISEIKYWNNLRRNLIRSGQKLVIYVPKNQVEKYAKINNMSIAEKLKMMGKPVNNTSANTGSNSLDYASGEFIYYTVKSGDTLWEIAQQFPGVTDTDIMRLNNITDVKSIKPGQVIKIKKKI